MDLQLILPVAYPLLTCMQIDVSKIENSYFFQKSGFLSFLILLFCVLVQNIDKIVEQFSSSGVTDRQASLHRTFTSYVQKV